MMEVYENIKQYAQRCMTGDIILRLLQKHRRLTKQNRNSASACRASSRIP